MKNMDLFYVLRELLKQKKENGFILTLFLKNMK